MAFKEEVGREQKMAFFRKCSGSFGVHLKKELNESIDMMRRTETRNEMAGESCWLDEDDLKKELKGKAQQLADVMANAKSMLHPTRKVTLSMRWIPMQASKQSHDSNYFNPQTLEEARPSTPNSHFPSAPPMTFQSLVGCVGLWYEYVSYKSTSTEAEVISMTHKRTMETDETIKPLTAPKPKRIKIEDDSTEDVSAAIGEKDCTKLQNFASLLN